MPNGNQLKAIAATFFSEGRTLEDGMPGDPRGREGDKNDDAYEYQKNPSIDRRKFMVGNGKGIPVCRP